MTLSEFIRANRATILEEWEAFASTLRPAAEMMTVAALRDHADEILTAVVEDMEEPQASREQSEKSRGRGTKHRMEAVGKIHALLRLQGGFRLDQLVAEYRALRGSILRLCERSGDSKLAEVTRFNEAIDEALTEATTRYAQTIERTRDQFLGILGHDLRTPLTGIVLSAEAIARRGSAIDGRAALRIVSTAGRMDRMVTTLLDLTRSRLGDGIPVVQKDMDLSLLLQEVVAEVATSSVSHKVSLEIDGDLRGEWDGDRIAQVLSNLIGNAVQHGDVSKTIRVVGQGGDNDVCVEVVNQGTPIASADLATIFDAMVRGGDTTKGPSTSLGLGLYIAREIVAAHGGTLTVASTTTKGTTFAMRLPRHPGVVRKQPRE